LSGSELGLKVRPQAVNHHDRLVRVDLAEPCAVVVGIDDAATHVTNEDGIEGFRNSGTCASF